MVSLNEQSVAQTLTRITEAWNAGRMDEVLGFYAEDATYVVQDRGFFSGRAEISAFFHKDFPDISQMGALEITPENCRLPQGDKQNFATALVSWTHVFGEDDEASGFSIIVLSVQDDEIYIVQQMDIFGI